MYWEVQDLAHLFDCIITITGHYIHLHKQTVTFKGEAIEWPVFVHDLNSFTYTLYMKLFILYTLNLIVLLGLVLCVPLFHCACPVLAKFHL